MKMAKASNRRIVPVAIWSFCAGLVVPASLEIFWWSYNHRWIIVRDSIPVEQASLVLWPTSLLFISPRAWTPLFLLLSVFCNAVLYLAFGAVFWFGLTRYRTFLIVPIAFLAGLWWRLLTL
jgi:hypothetical protein